MQFGTELDGAGDIKGLRGESYERIMGTWYGCFWWNGEGSFLEVNYGGKRDWVRSGLEY